MSVLAREVVHPPALSLPTWSAEPAAVDVTGASFLVVLVGEGDGADRTARDWAAVAAGVGPTRLAVLEDVDDAEDRAVLLRLLDESRTGVRLMVVGGQYDVLRVRALARDAGLVPAEITAHVVHQHDLPLYCAHCRATHRVRAAPGDVVTCAGCRRRVEVHPHCSATLGSFLGSAADARDPS